jgi:hypothetical protein
LYQSLWQTSQRFLTRSKGQRCLEPLWLICEEALMNAKSAVRCNSSKLSIPKTFQTGTRMTRLQETTLQDFVEVLFSNIAPDLCCSSDSVSKDTIEN